MKHRLKSILIFVKNVDKRFLSLYPKFGMKKTDARGYNGNVRQIMNAREMIDVKKYMKPGEISVFTINRLDPEGADILAANTIREMFHANLPESPELKLLVIFDEVRSGLLTRMALLATILG